MDKNKLQNEIFQSDEFLEFKEFRTFNAEMFNVVEFRNENIEDFKTNEDFTNPKVETSPKQENKKKDDNHLDELKSEVGKVSSTVASTAVSAVGAVTGGAMILSVVVTTIISLISVILNYFNIGATFLEYSFNISNVGENIYHITLNGDEYYQEILAVEGENVGTFRDLTPSTTYTLAVISLNQDNEVELHFTREFTTLPEVELTYSSGTISHSTTDTVDNYMDYHVLINNDDFESYIYRLEYLFGGEELFEIIELNQKLSSGRVENLPEAYYKVQVVKILASEINSEEAEWIVVSEEELTIASPDS